MNTGCTIHEIDEIAADYVAKIYSGDVCAQDCREIEDWLAEDKRHFRQYQKMLRTWDALGDYPIVKQALSNQNGLLKYQEVLKQQSISKYFFLSYKFLAIAACFCLVVFGAFLALQTTKDETLLVKHYQTLIGQQKRITLPDGSVVTLNTNTKLEADFRGGKRQINLAFGEAFFDIAKDPDRPMIIDLNSHKITVLGTQFNIFYSEKQINVAVLEGRVAFEPATIELPAKNPNLIEKKSNEKLLLTAGDEVTIVAETKKAAPILISKVDVRKVSDWRDGLIRFERKPLSQVISELNRYSRKKVLIQEQTVMELLVSGTFYFNDVQAILEDLDNALPIKVIPYSEHYVILSDN